MLHLKRILEYYTDEDHGITTQEIRTKLKQQEIDVERKTVYEDIHAVFSNHIINAFKSPASCKWPELTPDMVKKGEIKISGSLTKCTYIETYIDAPNSYGAMLRKKLRLVVDNSGKITRALEELQTSGTSLLGIIANAALKDSWGDIVKF